MTAPVDTVLFDIDDTLCEYRRPGHELLALAFDAHDVEPFFAIEDYYARYSEFSEMTGTVRDLRAACFAAIVDEHRRDPELGRAVAESYAEERNHQNVRFLPGARETIEAFADEYRLGAVTNGAPEMQAQKIDALGLDNRFETVVYAGYDTPAKPDPEPFRRALATLDSSPNSTVHVGNSLGSDVAGARVAGIRTAWLDDGSDPDPVPEYTLDSMADLHEPPWKG